MYDYTKRYAINTYNRYIRVCFVVTVIIFRNYFFFVFQTLYLSTIQLVTFCLLVEQHGKCFDVNKSCCFN
jgi:hypothetical protein